MDYITEAKSPMNSRTHSEVKSPLRSPPALDRKNGSLQTEESLKVLYKRENVEFVWGAIILSALVALAMCLGPIEGRQRTPYNSTNEDYS